MDAVSAVPPPVNEPVRTPIEVVQPHRHVAVLGTTREATPADVRSAVDAALAAAPAWPATSYDDRAAVLHRG